MLNRKARIAVFVSGGGTNLQALLDAQADGRLKSGEIVLVISSKAGAYALTRAEERGVATAVDGVRRDCALPQQIGVFVQQHEVAHRGGTYGA